MTSNPTAAVSAFSHRVPEAELDDLRTRLAAARLPERETVADGDRWAQGVPRADLVEVVEYWRDHYDWRVFERQLDSLGQFRTTVDGVGVHFLHRRSRRRDARPLLLTHGWPGSVVEFVDVIEELANPRDPGSPAFHVVTPSLPGFGFSDKPVAPGWGVGRIAQAWTELMTRIGYERFLAHGGDWGGVITTVLGAQHADHVEAIHTTFAQVPPGLSEDGLTIQERDWVASTRRFWKERTGYAHQQATGPQTIGYALVDSPVGLLAWIMDKFAEWSDTTDSPFETISRDRLLDNVTLYWLTRSGASSARIYAESYGRLDHSLAVDVPTAVTVYPHDIERYPRPWVQQRYRNLVRWSTPATGGHFASLEQPHQFTAEVQAAFA